MTRSTSREQPGVDRALGLDASSKRARWKWWLASGLALTAVAGGGMYWASAESTSRLRFKTEPVQRGRLVVTVTATGTLQPTNQVDVGIEVSGTIESVAVDYNDRVKLGQVLARLDTSKYRAQVLKSQATLRSARARVSQAQATVKEAASELARLKRAHELSGGKVPSPQDIDKAEATLARARADEGGARAAVAEAEAALEVAQTELTKAVIHSPINGIVLARSVEPGQTVAANFQAPVLFTLAEDLTKMELHVDVDEADVGQVQEGQKATFTVDAYPGRVFSAAVTQVRFGAQTVDGVVTYKTVLQVDNSDLALRPGMTATAEITAREIDNALLVPNAALRFSPPLRDEEERSNRGNVLSLLFPRPARTTPKRRDAPALDDKRQTVWTLRDGQPVAIALTVGATDGVMTEVQEGDVQPGLELLVDTISTPR